jgi:hypothetical protein
MWLESNKGGSLDQVADNETFSEATKQTTTILASRCTLTFRMKLQCCKWNWQGGRFFFKPSNVVSQFISSPTAELEANLAEQTNNDT